MAASEATRELLEDDLHFVSNLVRQKKMDYADLVVALVWAVVILVGFSIYDFSILGGSIFWCIALPVFGIGTGLYASRKQKECGVIDRDLARRSTFHWTSIPIFLVVTNFMFINRGYQPELMGQAVLLVLALNYYLAGVHFWRGFLWTGLAMASGIVWLAVWDGYPWTLTGILTFLTLTGCTMREWRRNGTAA